METPKLNIDGKSVSAKKPTLGVWRKIVVFNTNYESIQDLHKNMEAYEAMLDLLVDCYNRPEVTPESLEKNIPLDEFMEKFYQATGWVGTLIAGKMANIPEKNAEAATT